MIHHFIYLGASKNKNSLFKSHRFQINDLFIELIESDTTTFDKSGPSLNSLRYIDLINESLKYDNIDFYKKLNLIINNLNILCKQN